MLWAQYLESDAPPGARHYGYDRFCEIVAEHVRVNDLTAPIVHVPGHTMQVDWAGTGMEIIDPITRATTGVWCSLRRCRIRASCSRVAISIRSRQRGLMRIVARWSLCGVPLLVVPDNASTASNQISKGSRARDVNAAYAEFLQYYQCAAVPLGLRLPERRAMLRPASRSSRIG